MTSAVPGTDFRQIPLDEIRPSPHNPRKTFDLPALVELAQSITEKGVQVPILVRPVNGHYEIVYGERRWRAATRAELEVMPCIVRELDDREALEAATIENAARQDLSALEEGDAFKTLHETYGYSAEQIAAKVGKSKATVYARMKLAELGEEARAAVAEGKLDASIALLVARIPNDKLQAEAAKALAEEAHQIWRADDGGLSYREASNIIQSRYMTRLEGALFDTADETLVPDAGACGPCPKRTGNQGELFGDVDSADVCTDTACFGRKKDAAWKRQRKDAEAKGLKVLSDKDAKKMFSYGDNVAHDAPLQPVSPAVRAQAKAQGLELKTTIARAPSGKTVELVDRKLADKLLEAERRKSEKASKAGAERANVQDAKRDAEDELRLAILRAITTSIEKKGITEAYWTAMLKCNDSLDMHGVAERRDIKGGGPAVEAYYKKGPAPRRAAILLELIMSEYFYSPKDLEPFAELFGVDIKKLEAELDTPAEAKKPKPKAAAKKKATPAKKAKGKK